MASGNRASSSSSAIWTKDEDKKFETALGIFFKNTSDRWVNIVRFMGGTKTVNEVKYHYRLLVVDVNNIEAGRIPMPNYVDAAASKSDGKSKSA